MLDSLYCFQGYKQFACSNWFVGAFGSGVRSDSLGDRPSTCLRSDTFCDHRLSPWHFGSCETLKDGFHTRGRLERNPYHHTDRRRATRPHARHTVCWFRRLSLQSDGDQPTKPYWSSGCANRPHHHIADHSGMGRMEGTFFHSGAANIFSVKTKN